MKNILTLILFSSISFVESGSHPVVQMPVKKRLINSGNPRGNLFIITVDGLRWQEIFTGAQESLINSIEHTRDTANMKMLYWANSEKERRQKLMPFFWSILAQKGQMFGNRQFGNKVNTSNIYSFSYPGYNEMFTGNTDLLIASNGKNRNKHQNVLEYLNGKEEFNGKVVAFTSWDVFPYILNEERSGFMVNSGYENMEAEIVTGNAALINRVQADAVYKKERTRHDELTFLTAKEYIQQFQPKVVFIGLGETDEHAHNGHYDLYLQVANKTDRMLSELWQWIQTTPGYKDNTTLLITTDHGRGRNRNSWTAHGPFTGGSSETWLAMIGPDLLQLGEVRKEQQVYQHEMAGMIAGLMGEEFEQRFARRR